MTAMRKVSVAVPRPLAGCFDYLCDSPVTVGARVRVPFGRDRVIGVVLAVAAMDDTDGLKAVEAVLDTAPLLDAAQLALLRFAARYYQHPIGEVVQAALPVPLREGRPVLRQLPRRWRLTEAVVPETQSGSSMVILLKRENALLSEKSLAIHLYFSVASPSV